MSFTRRIIHTTAAKSEGERLSHRITRQAFLHDVQADTRTRDLFARWGHATGLDEAVAAYATVLDVAAVFHDLPHRSALHHNPAGLHQLAPSTVAQCTRLADACDQVLEDTRDARAAEAIDFVRGDLFHDPQTPVCAWLSLDLMDLFDAEVIGRTWGEITRVQVPIAPVCGRVPKGQQPKNDGEHLARNAHWFYLARVADPRTPEPQLAEEYTAEMRAKGVSLAPKNSARRPGVRGGREHANTSIVRHGIDDAWRLLTLPIAPDRWAREYFKTQR